MQVTKACIVSASKCIKNRLVTGLHPDPLSGFRGWEEGKEKEEKGGRMEGAKEGREEREGREREERRQKRS